MKSTIQVKLFAMRHLWGHFVHSRMLIRAWAQIHNFAPWNPHTARKKKAQCPAEHLMKKRYNVPQMFFRVKIERTH